MLGFPRYDKKLLASRTVRQDMRWDNYNLLNKANFMLQMVHLGIFPEYLEAKKTSYFINGILASTKLTVLLLIIKVLQQIRAKIVYFIFGGITSIRVHSVKKNKISLDNSIFYILLRSKPNTCLGKSKQNFSF